MSNFRRSLGLPFINCKVKLDLRWAKNCVVPEISRKSRIAGNHLVQEVTASTTTAK